METFRVPDVCKDELAVEEAECVADDEDMVVMIKPANYFEVELYEEIGSKHRLWSSSAVVLAFTGATTARVSISGTQSGIFPRVCVWHGRRHGVTPYGSISDRLTVTILRRWAIEQRFVR
jgi:hypothetical protein